MIKNYLMILVICGFGVSCSNPQTTQDFDESVNSIITLTGVPIPVAVDEEVIVILPCYETSKPDVYPGGKISPLALEEVIEKKDTSLGNIKVMDFYGDPATVGKTTYYTTPLCQVTFDVPSTQIAIIVEKFEKVLCSIFEVVLCTSVALEGIDVVVGPNIVHGTDPRRSNHPTCDQGTMTRLDKESATSNSFDVPQLRKFLGIDNVTYQGNTITVAIFDTGGSSNVIQHSRNLLGSYWPLSRIDRTAEADLSDSYTCKFSKIDGHGTIVSKIIEVIAPQAKRIVMKVCSGIGDCKDSDIIKAYLYFYNRYAEPPEFINMSFGTATVPTTVNSKGYDPLMRFLLAKAQTSMPNTLFVTSSGNNPSKDGSPHYPASHEADFNNVLAVGAYKLNYKSKLEPAAFSSQVTNYLAPGVNIMVEGNTNKRTGTSFAAPMVVGIGTLYMESSNVRDASMVRTELKRRAISSGCTGGNCPHYFSY